MRNIDENRVEKFIKKHTGYKKWLVLVLCLAIATGAVTLYVLNKPAVATTADTAENEVGIVLEDANGSDGSGDSENGQVTDNTPTADVPAITEEVTVEQTVEGTEENTEETTDYSDTYTSTGTATIVGADDAEQSSASASESASVSSEEGSSSTEASSADEADSADSASSAASVASTDEESFEYIEEVALKATLIDEFGEEIDPDKYTEIELPDFDDVLVLNDTDNPPYSEVKVNTGLFKYTTYSYVRATIGSSVITGIKKETVESSVSDSTQENSTTTDETDNAAAYTETESESASKNVTVYYYTTDGENYTQIEEDTVINFVYTQGTQTEYVYNDNNISITAKLQVAGAIPDDAELVVTQITSSTNGYNYDAYIDALNENADTIADEAGQESANTYDSSNTLMYDIAFMYEGVEIQPAEGSVSISVEFKNNQLTNDLSVSAVEDITVVHLPIKEEVKETSEITSTEEATDITAEDIEVITLTDATAEVSDTEKIEFSEDSFSIFAVTVYQSHEAGTDTFESVLGDAVNFGIVADTLVIGESETNFAVKNAYTYLQSGNDLTNPNEQTYIAGTLTGTLKIKGEDAYFITPSAYASQVSHTSGAEHLKLDTAYSSDELNSIVEDMMVYARAASADLASKSDTATLYYYEAGQKYFIDTTKYGAGTYYVTLDASDMSNIAQADKLQIYKNSDQVIVFNVTASSTINLYKYSVSTDLGSLIGSDTLASSSAYDSITQTIIWNFINATEVNSSGSVAGVFIAGQSNASWINYSTSSGWIVFPYVKIASGEWHNTYTGITQISGTAQLQAYKTIDDEYATVTGFKFTLYKLTGTDTWTEVQTVGNDEDTPHNVIFTPITYGNNSTYSSSTYQYVSLSVGESETFTYKIVESSGTTDSEGNSYTEDDTEYYAQVTVTCCRLNSYTSTTYYRVSAPVYYTDESCTTQCSDIPTFNNTTTEGTVGIALYKYVNGEDPGDLEFEFTVRVLKSTGELETLTTELTNDGKNIAYSFDYNSSDIIVDSKGNERIYVVITENDITDTTSSGITVTKDDDYIIARIDYPGTENQKIYYFRYSADDATEKGYIDNIESGDATKIKAGVVSSKTLKSANKISDTSDIAFYNTGTGNLRIHKMVVNDFGSDMVRDNTGTALLSNIVFRITNNSSGNYIVFTTFTGRAGDTGTATEYDGTTHTATGNTYTVTYNQSAQWTISSIPAGTYTVQEVADGLTLSYDASTNTSTAIEDTNLSRVTKYDVTVDEEESGVTKYGTGGENYRKVFSMNLSNHSDEAPNYVVVGSTSIGNTSHTQTVQVCNYYSIPIGPIEVSKNFSGGTWDEDMIFTFKIEAAGYSAYDSEGNGVTLSSQPMPEEDESPYAVVDTVSVTSADATLNEDGTYTAIAQFNSIPFRYEGTYYYKITETDTGIDGVTYDTTVYYVKVVVSKKYTTFTKSYTYARMTHPAGYTSDATETEDFYYLGADVTYATDSDFYNVIAKCELALGSEPDTADPDNNTFTATYTQGSVLDVCFNNTITGNLTVSKIWLDSSGNDAASSHTALTLYIWQRVEGTTQWTVYGSTQLSASNNWTQTITGLPLMDSGGNKYEYCIKESDDYIDTYLVLYSYNGSNFYGHQQSSVTVLEKVSGEYVEKTYLDTGYSMTVSDGDISYGTVTITNKSEVTNTLPSTGGMGTDHIYNLAILLITFACMGLLFSKLFFIKRRGK